MAKARKALWLGILGGLLVAGVGCKKSDADALANIGGKLAERAHGCSDRLEQKWSTLLGRLALESRVKNRLRWDKDLADSSIDVLAQDKIVELKGSVANDVQVRRAVELAESTLGVEKVVNSLRVGEQVAIEK